MNDSFVPTTFKAIEPLLCQHFQALGAPIDAFVESQIINAQHYQIYWQEDWVGGCGVHNKKSLTYFVLKPEVYAQAGELFAQAKALEQVSQALVFSSDEGFLSLAIDHHTRLSLQARLFRYQALTALPSIDLSYRLATGADLDLILNHSDDFFDADLAQQIENGQIYIGFRALQAVAFGIIEYGQLLPETASIGCYTHPDFRGAGVGKQSLQYLIQRVLAQNLQPVAGCWHLNHASRAMLLGCGMVSHSRYLNIQF